MKKPSQATVATIAELEQMTVAELIQYCKDNGLIGYSTAKRSGKKALIEWIYEKFSESYFAARDAITSEAEQALDVVAGDVAEVEVPVPPDQDEDEDDEPGAERVVAAADTDETANVICLSVEPAMAYAIANLGKSIENRSWRTSYTGWLHIHASKSKTHYHAHRRYIESLGMKCPNWDDLPKGCLVCKVWLDRVSAAPAIGNESTPWGITGQYWWILRNPQPVKHIPMKGKLGLFSAEMPPEQIDIEGAGKAEVKSVDFSPTLKIGGKVKIHCKDPLINGKEGILLGAGDDLARVGIPEGEYIVSLANLTPVAAEKVEPQKPFFKIGDHVLINGYLLDGQRAIVLDVIGNVCLVASLNNAQQYSIPSEALRLVSVPASEALKKKLTTAVNLLLGKILLATQQSTPNSFIENNHLIESAVVLLNDLAANQLAIKHAAQYAIAMGVDSKEVDDYLEKNFSKDNNACFPKDKLPQFAFEITDVKYIQDALDVTETHFITLAKNEFLSFCGYANLKTGKAFTTCGGEFAVSLKFAQLRLLTKAEILAEARRK